MKRRDAASFRVARRNAYAKGWIIYNASINVNVASPMYSTRCLSRIFACRWENLGPTCYYSRCACMIIIIVREGKVRKGRWESPFSRIYFPCTYLRACVGFPRAWRRKLRTGVSSGPFAPRCDDTSERFISRDSRSFFVRPTITKADGPVHKKRPV